MGGEEGAVADWPPAIKGKICEGLMEILNLSVTKIHIMVLVWRAADRMASRAKEKSSESVKNPRSVHVFARALRNMWYLKFYNFEQKNLFGHPLPRKPLYWFDEHRINP